MLRENQNASLARACVMGIGGSGGQMINRMVARNIQGVDFVSVNTDTLALADSRAATRLFIGENVTRGVGCGGDVALATHAAYESSHQIQALLANLDVLFLVAGLGGGTGTGVTPIVAEIAQDLGVLTIALVTLPFEFEGSRRLRVAESGVEALHDRVDSMLVLPNSRLLRLVEKQTSLSDAFRLVDDVLCHAVQAISDLVTTPALVNLDFAGFRSVLLEAGTTLMTVGQASGQNRAAQAAAQALVSPLLNLSIAGARSLLVNITSDSSVTLGEIEVITNIIRGAADPDAKFAFGSVINERMRHSLRVTVIATIPDSAPEPLADAAIRRAEKPAEKPAVPLAPPVASLPPIQAPPRAAAAKRRFAPLYRLVGLS